MSHPPLFCPFCRECFEDAEVCPEHELPLVPFDRLPSRAAPEPGDDEAVAPHDLRFGRGWLLLASVLLLGGMAAPLVSSALGSRGITASGYGLASDRALNLWVIPAVALTYVSVLLRRRTPRQMRGSRIAVPVLALLVAGSLGYTLLRIHRATELAGMELTVRWGIVPLAAGVVLGLAAGLRFGKRHWLGRRSP